MSYPPPVPRKPLTWTYSRRLRYTCLRWLRPDLIIGGLLKYLSGIVTAMTELTGAQLRKLKALAQRLDPVVRLGKNGLSEAFVRSLVEALAHHELVKIRFDEFKDQRKALAPEIASRSDSRFIWMVGHVAVFYRPNPDPEKRKVLV